MPITTQTIDKTTVKPGGVVRNWELKMEHCNSRCAPNNKTHCSPVA